MIYQTAIAVADQLSVLVNDELKKLLTLSSNPSPPAAPAEAIFSIEASNAVKSTRTTVSAVIVVAESPMATALPNKDTCAVSVLPGTTAVPSSVARVVAVNELAAFFRKVRATSSAMAAPLRQAGCRHGNYEQKASNCYPQKPSHRNFHRFLLQTSVSYKSVCLFFLFSGTRIRALNIDKQSSCHSANFSISLD